MKAIVNFKNGTSKLTHVNTSFSRAGIHYYDLTINALPTFLDFKSGERKTFTGDEISKLTYVMA